MDLPANCKPAVNSDGSILPGFAVREDGTVLYHRPQWKRWVALKPKTGPSGFHRVALGSREVGVALLVLRAFVGPRPIGCEPLHWPDPNPGNNHLANLRWAPRGTSKIGRTLGPSPPPVLYGSARPIAVLTEEDIPHIRRMYRTGWPYKDIADDFGVSEDCVRHVLIGKTWSHVIDPDGPVVMRHAGPDSEGSPRAKLDWETVAIIRRERTEGLSYRQIAARHDIDRCTVRDIAKRRTWKNPP